MEVKSCWDTPKEVLMVAHEIMHEVVGTKKTPFAKLELWDFVLENRVWPMIAPLVLPHSVVGIPEIAKMTAQEATCYKPVDVVLVVPTFDMPEGNTFDEDMFVAWHNLENHMEKHTTMPVVQKRHHVLWCHLLVTIHIKTLFETIRRRRLLTSHVRIRHERWLRSYPGFLLMMHVLIMLKRQADILFQIKGWSFAKKILEFVPSGSKCPTLDEKVEGLLTRLQNPVWWLWTIRELFNELLLGAFSWCCSSPATFSLLDWRGTPQALVLAVLMFTWMPWDCDIASVANWEIGATC